MCLVQRSIVVHSKHKDLFLEEHYICITMCTAQQNLTVELIINSLKKENKRLPLFSPHLYTLFYILYNVQFSYLPSLLFSVWHYIIYIRLILSAVDESNLFQT